ncbi:MAG: FecR domain-containing protein [Acetobacter sp.]|uniref:FecR family protein n=1 Tax=Acetobacter sp. TaxID=440 RepID=UPI0039E8FA3C
MSNPDLTPEEAEALEWLLALEEDSHAPDIHARFEAWKANEANARAWANVSRVYAGIGETAPVHEETWRPFVPERRDLPGASAPATARRCLRRRQIWAGASLAACIVMAWGVFDPPVRLLLGADDLTGTGETKVIDLADGGTVTLAPRSAIAFEGSRSSRHMRLLQGEAWFDVRHDAMRPFRVAARDLGVTDIGTRFDVRLGSAETDVSVEVGAVEVSADNVPAISETLRAGQTLSVSTTHLVSRDAVDPSLVAGWRDGALSVRNRPMRDVIEDIRPWYRGVLIVRGDGLAARRVTGLYDLHHPEAAMRALAAAYGGRVIRVTPWVIIFVNG